MPQGCNLLYICFATRSKAGVEGKVCVCMCVTMYVSVNVYVYVYVLSTRICLYLGMSCLSVFGYVSIWVDLGMFVLDLYAYVCYVYVYVYVNAYVLFIYGQMYTCMYVYLCVCMRMCACMYVYIYIYGCMYVLPSEAHETRQMIGVSKVMISQCWSCLYCGVPCVCIHFPIAV